MKELGKVGKAWCIFFFNYEHYGRNKNDQWILEKRGERGKKWNAVQTLCQI